MTLSSQPSVFMSSNDERAAARRQLVGVVAGAVVVLVVSMLLDRSELRLTGPWRSLGSWTGSDAGLLGLRVLRAVSFFGAVAVLVWLAVLMVLCFPQRGRAVVSRLGVPGAGLVRRALIGTLTVAIATSGGSSAFATSRSITAPKDANGGQRWPTLRIQDETPVAATTILPPPTVPPLVTATTPTTPATPTAMTAVPTTTVPTSAVPNSAALPIDRQPTTTAGPQLPGAVRGHVAVTRNNTSEPAVPARTVRAGESFWSIAEDEVLAQVDEATEVDISRYWVRLIDANRDRIPDPANPDLLLISTELVLPAIAPPVVS